MLCFVIQQILSGHYILVKCQPVKRRHFIYWRDEVNVSAPLDKHGHNFKTIFLCVFFNSICVVLTSVALLTCEVQSRVPIFIGHVDLQLLPIIVPSFENPLYYGSITVFGSYVKRDIAPISSRVPDLVQLAVLFGPLKHGV